MGLAAEFRAFGAAYHGMQPAPRRRRRQEARRKGARLGRGCTSGHGICGLASLGRPSLAAVVTFMATAILTAQLMLRVAA
jgi:hypothetical protein